MFYFLRRGYVLDLLLIDSFLVLSQSTDGLLMQFLLLGLQRDGMVAINIQILDFHIDINL